VTGLESTGIESLLSVALWAAGIGHFVVLMASFQVPARLGWKDDLPKLTSFNRKLMWTYGGFIVLTIASFGAMTLSLHGELVRGERGALHLAAFIGVFWLTRIVVDTFYFQHDDWPRGKGMVLGHVLLTSLFVCLAATYFGVVIWHWFAVQGGAS
jgi:alginate O-acetyltransferase complex protein AlgI